MRLRLNERELESRKQYEDDSLAILISLRLQSNIFRGSNGFTSIKSSFRVRADRK